MKILVQRVLMSVNTLALREADVDTSHMCNAWYVKICTGLKLMDILCMYVSNSCCTLRSIQSFPWPVLHLSMRINVFLETEWYRARAIFKSRVFTISEYSLQTCDGLAIQGGPRCWDGLQLSRDPTEDKWVWRMDGWNICDVYFWLTELVRSPCVCSDLLMMWITQWNLQVIFTVQYLVC